jgi:hypothetical protein
MTPGNRTITAIAGVQMTKVFYWKTGPAAGPNVAVDLTGYSARFVVARTPQGTSELDLTSANGDITLAPLLGKVTVNFSRAAMALAPGEHHYYLVLTSPAGMDYPLLTGRFAVAANGVPE